MKTNEIETSSESCGGGENCSRDLSFVGGFGGGRDERLDVLSRGSREAQQASTRATSSRALSLTTRGDARSTRIRTQFSREAWITG